MLVRIERRMVDVKDKGCVKRPCFALGFDKGSFAQGRGYTSYRTDAKGRRVEKPVCATRHYHGCPVNSVCAKCRLCSVEAPGAKCERHGCDGVTIERENRPTDRPTGDEP